MTTLYFRFLAISMLCISGITGVKAQFTITSSNLPVKSSIVYYYKDTLPFATITEGNAGLNQTWHFKLLEKTLIDTITYLDPSLSSPSYNFPSATLISKKDSVYTFYQNNNNIYTVLGTLTTKGHSTILKPNYKLFKFPMTYKDSIKDTAVYKTLNVLDAGRKSLIKQYFGKTYDSTRTTNSILRNNKIDATGTVYTPEDTFTNVMRIRRFIYTLPVVEFKDSATNKWEQNVALSNYFGKKDTTLTYEWYAANYRSPVITMTLKGSDEVIKDVSYLTQKSKAYNSIAEISHSAALSTYPNPASGYITFNINEPLAQAVCIYDMNSKLMTRLRIASTYNEPITYNISTLNEGTYIYTLVNSKGVTLAKGKFTIVK